MYQFVHLFHFVCAAVWLGTYVASDYLTWTLERAGDRLERARTVRRLGIAIEMPLAVIVPLVGFALVLLQARPGLNPTVWQEGWLHAKLSGFVVLLILVFLGSRRSRRLVEALEANDDESAARQRRGYLVLRIVGLAAFILIFVAVVFRF